MTPKLFPILRSYEERRKFPEVPDSLPWEFLEPHERQALRNHGGQTLARLAERGGLGVCEALAVVEGRAWSPMVPVDAWKRLQAHLTVWEAQRNAK